MHDVTAEPAYFCQHCDKGFVKKPSYIQHLKEHAGKTNSNVHTSHVTIHENETGFSTLAMENQRVCSKPFYPSYYSVQRETVMLISCHNVLFSKATRKFA